MSIEGWGICIALQQPATTRQRRRATAGWEVGPEHFRSTEHGARIEIRFPDVPHAVFAPIFEAKLRFINLRCGLKWRPGQSHRVPAVTAALNGAFSQARSNEWWPWSAELDEHNGLLPLPSNWEATNEPWVMINDGELHLLVIEAAQRVHDALEAARLLGIDPSAKAA